VEGPEFFTPEVGSFSGNMNNIGGDTREVAQHIREGIQQRGFYVLFDQKRFELICGNGESSLRTKQERIHAFAHRHGWQVHTRHGVTTALFIPLDDNENHLPKQFNL